MPLILILIIASTTPIFCSRLPYNDVDYETPKTETAKTDISDRKVHFSNYAHCVTESNLVDLNWRYDDFIHVPHTIHNVTCMSWDGPTFDPMNVDILDDDHCYAYPKACTTVLETKTVFRRSKQGSDCWRPVQIPVASGCKCAILFSKTTE